MDMEMVGWLAIGWFAVALVVSIALGGFLGQVNAGPDEEELASAMTKRKGMRFMRSSTARSLTARDLKSGSRASETGKHSVKVTG